MGVLDMIFCCVEIIKDKWKQLGNTIPTIFTEMIGLNLNKHHRSNELNANNQMY